MNTWYHRMVRHREKQCHFLLYLGSHCAHKSQNSKTSQPSILCFQQHLKHSSRREVGNEKQPTTSEIQQTRISSLVSWKEVCVWKQFLGTSLVIQRLWLQGLTAEGLGLIPGRYPISHVVWPQSKKGKKKERKQFLDPHTKPTISLLISKNSKGRIRSKWPVQFSDRNMSGPGLEPPSPTILISVLLNSRYVSWMLACIL